MFKFRDWSDEMARDFKDWRDVVRLDFSDDFGREGVMDWDCEWRTSAKTLSDSEK